MIVNNPYTEKYQEAMREYDQNQSDENGKKVIEMREAYLQEARKLLAEVKDVKLKKIREIDELHTKIIQEKKLVASSTNVKSKKELRMMYNEAITLSRQICGYAKENKPGLVGDIRKLKEEIRNVLGI